jgi:hypothetical protein
VPADQLMMVVPLSNLEAGPLSSLVVAHPSNPEAALPASRAVVHPSNLLEVGLSILVADPCLAYEEEAPSVL